MNTQPQPAQPQPKADRPLAEVQTQPQPVLPPSVPQQTKSTNTVLMVFGFVLLLIIASGAAYLFGSGKIGMLGLSPTPTPTTTTTPPMISETPTSKQVTITGVFTTIWNGETSYTITDDQGQTTQLLLDNETAKPLGGPLELDRKRVTIVGEITSDSPRIVRVLSVQFANANPTVSITQKPKPTIIPNPDGNTFTSDKLGIAFYWANKTPADASATVKVLESGSKVYVYPSSGKPEDGQSIERFDKSSTDTLSQAISKKFLAGIPTTDCFVKINPVKPKPTVTKATISYPIPADADQPNFTYGEKCPQGYSESNGMAYFFEDSTYPDRFYYVSIGQYGIPAQNSKPDSMWQDTIIVY